MPVSPSSIGRELLPPLGLDPNVAPRRLRWKGGGPSSPDRLVDAGSYTALASVAGWCNWQHTSLWIWELGFESLPGSWIASHRARPSGGRTALTARNPPRGPGTRRPSPPGPPRAAPPRPPPHTA